MRRGVIAAILLALAGMRAEAQAPEVKGRCSPSGFPRGEFGAAVAIGNNGVIAIGDYRNDVVYLFKVTSGECQKTDQMQGSPGEWFGFSLAVEENLLLVGAPKAGGTTATGGAYLVSFSKEGIFEDQRRQLSLSPTIQQGDEAGSSVAISGVTLAVGARGADDPRGEDNRRGRVYVGTEAAGLTAVLSPSGLALRAELGQSVALSGTTLVMGAPSPYLGSGSPGAAYVYEVGSGVPPNPLKVPPGLQNESAFGYAVAIGDQILVGAPLADTNGADAGAVFRFDGAQDAEPDVVLVGNSGHQLGVAVALDGGTFLIGARYVNNKAGAAYLVKQGGSVQSLSAGQPAGAQLGFSVALRGDIAVVGAFQEEGRGAAYVFARQEQQQLCQEPDIVSSPQGTLQTSEAGKTADLSFHLSCPPAADVTLSLSTSDGTEGTIAVLPLPAANRQADQAVAVTFTAENWQTDRTFRVTGQDDADCDGDQAYSVRVQATTKDSLYKDFPIPAKNADDERACLSAMNAVKKLCVDGDGTVIYTITLSGAVKETTASLVDRLPPEVSVVFATADPGVAIVGYAGNSVQWNGPVPPDTGVMITILAALDGVPSGTEVRNQATFTYDRDGRGHIESVETNPTVFATGQTPCDSPPPP